MAFVLMTMMTEKTVQLDDLDVCELAIYVHILFRNSSDSIGRVIILYVCSAIQAYQYFVYNIVWVDT